jgi:hypothetical protein
MNRRIVAAAALATTLVVACGTDSSDPPSKPTAVTLAANVVIADPPFSSDSRVDPVTGAVTIGTVGHENVLDKVHPGTILVGEPSDAHPDQNPDGYLRRVTGISTVGGDTVITTEPASLADAIVDGAFNVTLPLLNGDPVLTPQSVHPLGLPPPGGTTFNIPDISILNTGSQNVTAGSTGLSGSAEVTLRNNSLRLSALPKFEASFANGRLQIFHGEMAVGYEARTTVHVNVSGSVSQSVDKVIARAKLGRAKFFVGLLPVWVTVVSKVSVECQVSSGGTVEADVNLHAYGTPALGAHYEKGGWSKIGDLTDFTLDTESDVKKEGAIKLECGMPIELDTFIYGSLGPYASAGAFVEMEAAQNNCVPPKVKFDITAFDQLKLGVKMEILDETLASWYTNFKSTPPIHIYPKEGPAPAVPECKAPQECTSDTGCGAGKACSWDGKEKCCRTPTSSAGATKCLADKECPSGQVCGWNLEYFVCQAPLCN